MGIMVPCQQERRFLASKHVTPPTSGINKLSRAASNQGAHSHCSASWRRAHTTLRSLRRRAVSTVLLPSNTLAVALEEMVSLNSVKHLLFR